MARLTTLRRVTTRNSPESEIRRLIRLIKASKVAESGTQLISQLGELDVSDEKERASILECLITCWKDFICMDISYCQLHKKILQVAANHLELDTSKGLGQHVDLGTKGSIWCKTHLEKTLVSQFDVLNEEHYELFFKVLLEMLSYSASVLSALGKHKVLSIHVQEFIVKLLSLTQDSIIKAKTIRTYDLKILQASQAILVSVIKLCEMQMNEMKLRSSHNDCIKLDLIEHTLTSLVNLGILFANGDDSLLGVHEISWEGVVNLLQLGKGFSTVQLNISEIILSLISLAKGALTYAQKIWSALIKPVSEEEAQRIFVRVKSYLNNADSIISHYPFQAFEVFKDIGLCILTVLAFRVFLGKYEIFKYASETLVEHLEPASLRMLNSLLDSELTQTNKFEIVEWFFMDMKLSQPLPLDKDTMKGIFSLKGGMMHGCDDLWNFIPAYSKFSLVLKLGFTQNARILDSLKSLFINTMTSFSSYELVQLVKEIIILKGLPIADVADVTTMDSDGLEIDAMTQAKKKRKFPQRSSENVSFPRGTKPNPLHEFISLPRTKNSRSTIPIYNEALVEYWIPWNRKPRSRDKKGAKQQWSKEEDEKLKKFVSQHGCRGSWTKASEELKTKTPFQCLTRFQRSHNPNVMNRDWTSDEDNQLDQGVKLYGERWQQIASLLPGRTGTQCSSRWRSALVRGRRTGRWERDEDERLKIAVKLFGNTCWKQLATCVPGRTEIQVRERWCNILDPNLKFEPWTEEEDRTLIDAVTKHEYQWSRVAECMPSRTDNQCQRRWNQLFRDEAKVLKEIRAAQRDYAPSNFVDRENERPLFAKLDSGNHKQQRRPLNINSCPTPLEEITNVVAN